MGDNSRDELVLNNEPMGVNAHTDAERYAAIRSLLDGKNPPSMGMQKKCMLLDEIWMIVNNKDVRGGKNYEDNV